MTQTMDPAAQGRLERSCTDDAIRHIPVGAGIIAYDARFHTHAFSPHRHDTYAIGMTTVGTQTFRYRKSRHFSRVGDIHILFPDECHDGASFDETSFGYRILHIDPALISAACGGALPFVDNPVLQKEQIAQRIGSLLGSLLAQCADAQEPLLFDALIATLADALAEAAGDKTAQYGRIDNDALERVRDALEVSGNKASMDHLERIAGMDRWSLHRQFKRAFGTSPGRYKVNRQVEHARQAIEQGMPLAEVATEAGFSDQPHMTRHFRKVIGMTPGQWQNFSRHKAHGL